MFFRWLRHVSLIGVVSYVLFMFKVLYLLCLFIALELSLLLYIVDNLWLNISFSFIMSLIALLLEYPFIGELLLLLERQFRLLLLYIFLILGSCFINLPLDNFVFAICVILPPPPQFSFRLLMLLNKFLIFILVNFCLKIESFKFVLFKFCCLCKIVRLVRLWAFFCVMLLRHFEEVRRLLYSMMLPFLDFM